MSEKIDQGEIDEMAATSITGLSDLEALDQVGALIDASSDACSTDGTNQALKFIDELQERVLTPDLSALLHYFRANALENKRKEPPNGDAAVWAWDQPEMRLQILELRRAIRHEGFTLLPPVRQCQILTNLANQLSVIGHFIEAIEIWDRVLDSNEHFAMALGNRGESLSHYGRGLYDPGHVGVMLTVAYDSLGATTAPEAIFECEGYEHAKDNFEQLKLQIDEHVNIDDLRRTFDLDGHSLGESVEERQYRTWCLDNRVFVNPLNDLGSCSIAAHDVLTLPSIVAPVGSVGPPEIIGFFNQMKQEFVSARFHYYEGLKSDEPHFSDRGVLLYDTLDYPAYSLATEKIRNAFRVFYSLFDKISFFINEYFEIGHDPQRVNFRNVWYEQKGSPRALLPEFEGFKIWPLRGLHWLSKEFFDEELWSVADSDAQALNKVRNHLEHKYLRLRQSHFDSGMSNEASDNAVDPLGFTLSDDDLAAKTLRLMKLARAALIYLSLAVYCEERSRESKRGDGLTASMPLVPWPDEWKR